MIKYDHIAKRYQDNLVIKDVSFEIHQGELFVLVGPSGSGKTTLLKMFNRLIEPSAGQIYYHHQDLCEKNLQKLRLQTGYVLQDSSLFPNLTIQDNITIQLEQLGVSREQRHQRAAELLTAVDLDPQVYASRYPTELSGGEQQRVGIVRALATQPAVILMDEPFSALDPVVRRQLQELVLKLQKQTQTTIMFVTHDMQEALRLGTHIAVLKDGVLQQQGTPQEIINHPATPFVKTFFHGHNLQDDLTTVLENGLGKKKSLTDHNGPVVHCESMKELLAFCRDHEAPHIVVQTDSGVFQVERADVWNYLIRREEERA